MTGAKWDFGEQSQTVHVYVCTKTVLLASTGTDPPRYVPGTIKNSAIAKQYDMEKIRYWFVAGVGDLKSSQSRAGPSEAVP